MNLNYVCVSVSLCMCVGVCARVCVAGEEEIIDRSTAY